MISIESNIKEVQKSLEQTGKSLKTIQKGVLRIVGKGTVKAIKEDIKLKTTKRTGELLKAYTYKLNRKGEMKVQLNYKKNGDKIFPKVYTLNYGKEGKNWQPRYFVQTGMRYAENGNYNKEIENYIEKELTKYWTKK